MKSMTLFALILIVSIQDAHANDMDAVKKYSNTDSVAKVVFSESRPSDIRQISEVIERVARTFDPGDQIEVTVMNQASDPTDSNSPQRLQRWELEVNHVSRQRNLARERLSRASEEIQRGNLTANSKYYRDLLDTYKNLDEKYKHALEQVEHYRKLKYEPSKKVLTVQSTDQIVKELKPYNSASSHILLIRRISVKDLTRGAVGFALAAGAMAPGIAAEMTKGHVESRTPVIQPRPYQAADGVN